MTVYNKKTPRRNQGTSPVKAASVPTGTTHEGHPGYEREPKSELFLLGTTQFMGQDSFYEKAKDRDNRFVHLVRTVAVEDPVWMLHFVKWLRGEANIRTAAMVAGLEAADALRLGKFNWMHEGQGMVRQLAKAGIRRADEPGEALAYWTTKYGKNVPMPVKRALADKVLELYNERNLLKYDTDSHGFRFGDVIELCHPRPRAPWQDSLFKYAIERRHNRGGAEITNLFMVETNLFLREYAQRDPLLLLDPEELQTAGMTWEDVLSLAGSKIPKKQLWESMIPSMGYMALLRNLRNFDQADVSDDHARFVAETLARPSLVAVSRQLPMRFLSAYREAPSLRWSWPLEQALQLSLANIPELSGNTLILVDTSGSMSNRFSDRSTLQRWDAAALFGIALAQRCETAEVVSFSRTSVVFRPVQGESLLASLKRWKDMGYNLNSGTETVKALQAHLSTTKYSAKRNHNRVVIITDEQASGGYDALRRYRRYGQAVDQNYYMTEVNQVVPASTPLHVINVAGYEKGMVPSGGQNRFVYGGLTDSVFRLIELVERGEHGKWPWERDPTPST